MKKETVFLRAVRVVLPVLLFAIAFSGCSQLSAPVAADTVEFDAARATRVNLKDKVKNNVIYVGSLSELSDADFKCYTHVCVHFVNIDGDTGKISNDFANKKLSKEKIKTAHANGVKILASLAGGSKDQAVALYRSLYSDDSRTTKLISELVSLVNDPFGDGSYSLDGIDLDWEYFGSSLEEYNGLTGSDVYAACNPNYVKLVNKLEEKLGKKGSRSKLITIAAQTEDDFFGDSAIKEMLKKLDFVSVMTYDYNSSTSKVGYNGNFERTRETVDAYGKIVGYANVNIGIPFYGYRFENYSSTSYGSSATRTGDHSGKPYFYEIYDTVGSSGISNASHTQYYENYGPGVAYCTKNSVLYIYDDPTTIAAKIKWAMDKGCGGAMAWEFKQDKNQLLQNAVVTALNEAPRSSSSGSSSSSSSGSSSSSSSSSSALSVTYSALPSVLTSWSSSSSQTAGTIYAPSGVSVSYSSSTNAVKIWSSQTEFDVYIRYKDAPSKGTFSIDACSSASFSITAMENYNNSQVLRNSLISSAKTLASSKSTVSASSTLVDGNKEGWIRLHFKRSGSTNSNVYVYGFKIK